MINQEKTKYMEMTNNRTNKDSIKINHYKFECVKQFKYLGTIITYDNNITTEINARIYIANKSYYGLKKQLQSHFLSKKTKCKLYKTLITPVLTYGAESWVLNKDNIERLMIFERKVLRKIFGPLNDRGMWRIRYNTEIYNLYKEPDIIKVIKASRIRWLGHLYRGEENNISKKITFNDPLYATRKIGRPAKRWIDDVESDLNNINVRQWKKKAQERNQWKKVIGAVLA